MWWNMLINPDIWEVEIGRIAVRGQTGQKVSKTPSQQITGHSVIILAASET
jgi:hypothetical protein